MAADLAAELKSTYPRDSWPCAADAAGKEIGAHSTSTSTDRKALAEAVAAVGIADAAACSKVVSFA
jgi:hypothetical protein